LEQWSMAPLFQCSFYFFYFFLKNQWKKFSFFFRTTLVQLIVDNIFFVFLKKLV
jgi:hypothetical protein